MAIVDVLIRGAQREVQNVKTFVTTPTGVFSTADKIIVDARRTVRELAEQVGVKPGAFLRQRRRFRR